MFSGESVLFVDYKRGSSLTTRPSRLRRAKSFATAGLDDPTMTSFRLCRFFSIPDMKPST